MNKSGKPIMNVG